jgi:hypothetical protein
VHHGDADQLLRNDTDDEVVYIDSDEAPGHEASRESGGDRAAGGATLRLRDTSGHPTNALGVAPATDGPHRPDPSEAVASARRGTAMDPDDVLYIDSDASPTVPEAPRCSVGDRAAVAAASRPIDAPDYHDVVLEESVATGGQCGDNDPRAALMPEQRGAMELIDLTADQPDRDTAGRQDGDGGRNDGEAATGRDADMVDIDTAVLTRHQPDAGDAAMEDVRRYVGGIGDAALADLLLLTAEYVQTPTSPARQQGLGSVVSIAYADDITAWATSTSGMRAIAIVLGVYCRLMHLAINVASDGSKSALMLHLPGGEQTIPTAQDVIALRDSTTRNAWSDVIAATEVRRGVGVTAATDGQRRQRAVGDDDALLALTATMTREVAVPRWPAEMTTPTFANAEWIHLPGVTQYKYLGLTSHANDGVDDDLHDERPHRHQRIVDQRARHTAFQLATSSLRYLPLAHLKTVLTSTLIAPAVYGSPVWLRTESTKVLSDVEQSVLEAVTRGVHGMGSRTLMLAATGLPTFTAAARTQLVGSMISRMCLPAETDARRVTATEVNRWGIHADGLEACRCGVRFPAPTEAFQRACDQCRRRHNAMSAMHFGAVYALMRRVETALEWASATGGAGGRHNTSALLPKYPDNGPMQWKKLMHNMAAAAWEYDDERQAFETNLAKSVTGVRTYGGVAAAGTQPVMKTFTVAQLQALAGTCYRAALAVLETHERYQDLARSTSVQDRWRTLLLPRPLPLHFTPTVEGTALRMKFLMGVPYVVGIHYYQRLSAVDRSMCLLCGATDSEVKQQASAGVPPTSVAAGMTAELRALSTTHLLRDCPAVREERRAAWAKAWHIAREAGVAQGPLTAAPSTTSVMTVAQREWWLRVSLGMPVPEALAAVGTGKWDDWYARKWTAAHSARPRAHPALTAMASVTTPLLKHVATRLRATIVDRRGAPPGTQIHPKGQRTQSCDTDKDLGTNADRQDDNTDGVMANKGQQGRQGDPGLPHGEP